MITRTYVNRNYPSSVERINEAVGRGLEWLVSLEENGVWRGFPTAVSASETWTTAFVTSHLQMIDPSLEAIGRGQKYLAQARRESGGWSWGPGVPADADSTSWALTALRESGLLEPSQILESEAFLLSHLSTDGFSTFNDPAVLREYLRVPPLYILAGWLAVHDDVSAAALAAGYPQVPEQAHPLLSLMLDRVRHSGSYRAHWWRTPFMTSALLLRAKDRLGLNLQKQDSVLVTHMLRDRRLSGGGFSLDDENEFDAFTTALSLESNIRLGDPSAAELLHSTVEALLASQDRRGSWRGNYALRIPRPYVVCPEVVDDWTLQGSGNTFVQDEHGLFATTLACYSLSLVSRPY